MDQFCLGLSLVIGPIEREGIVFSGPGTAITWRDESQVLLQSACFKFPGLEFNKSGSLSDALHWLAQNAVGACAQLRTRFKKMLYKKSFPVMRPLFDALVLPKWVMWFNLRARSCSPNLLADIR